MITPDYRSNLLSTNQDEFLPFYCIDEKKKMKSIIDASVYSSNQNLRLMLSSKFGKSIPLLLRNADNVINAYNLNVFLDSLVSGKDFDVNVANVTTPIFSGVKTFRARREPTYNHDSERAGFKGIEERIKSIIFPGYIRSITVFNNSDSGKVLVYRVDGFRFCLNINREHKKNNVYFVYNFLTDELYQRCYDLDCEGFRSRSFKK